MRSAPTYQPLRLPALLSLPARPASQALTARRDWSLLIVMALTAIAGLVALYWSYSAHLVLGYNDSASHLNIARRILDSRSPGIAQFGTIWLPVPHMLMQPFVYNDFLWHSGLAGSIVGLFCLEVTAVSLFLAARQITSLPAAPWIGIAVLLTNPNILYMQTTALTEPVMLMALTGAAFFLLRWSLHGRHADLLGAGLLSMVAVGSRYDGWFFAVAATGLVALTVHARWRNATRTEGVTLAYMSLPFYAMLLWFFYNWLIFGSPLAFQQGQSDEIAREVRGISPALLPKHHVLQSLLTYSWATIDNLGMVLAVCAAAGIVIYLCRARFQLDNLMPLAFLSSFPFNTVSLWLAQAIIFTPQTAASGYFNIRYGVMMVPGAALFIAYLADAIGIWVRPRLVPVLAVVVLGAQAMLWLPHWPASVVTVADATIGQSGSGPLRAAAAPRFLERHYRGGSILLDEVSYPPYFTITTHIDLREYLASYRGSLWQQALQDPTPLAAWVVINRQRTDDRVGAALKGNRAFALHYALRFTEAGIAIYQRVVR